MLLFVSSTVMAGSFLYNDIKILAKEDIQKLSDDVLMETYIEARIEEEASAEFHRSAGFSSEKEYDQRKKLLRYIFDLRREMSARKSIDTESVDKDMK